MVVEIPRVEEKLGGRDESAVLPSSVEEPEQDIPEVEMKTSSWYEIDPHRQSLTQGNGLFHFSTFANKLHLGIVITDLDSFESEDGNVDGGNEFSGVTVNANLLKYLKDQPPLVPRGLLGSPAGNQALVLFRPLLIPDEVEQRVRDVESMEVEF
jgi:hypothetical protein